MKKITIVDDSSFFRKALKQILYEIGGVEIISEAENGAELLRLITKNKPDIIFMDIEMPYINGFEATKSVNSLYPSIKIIGMSANEKDSFVHKLIDLGAKGYLIKSGDNYETIKKLIHDDYDEFIYSPEINYHKPLLKSKKTILSLENLNNNNLNIRHHMRKAGYNILKANNITETFFFFKENNIDGVFIGKEILKKNNKIINRIISINKNPNLQIFILTNKQENTQNKIKENIIIHKLKQNFNPEIIIETIENI